MSMWTRARQQRALTLDALGVPRRDMPRNGVMAATRDVALRHSGVWAALRVRADLMSTFPVDAYRKVDKINVEISKPPVLINPGGEDWPLAHWMWATQFDLDSAGNTVGLIRSRDGLGFPSEIEPMPASVCSMRWLKKWDTYRWKIDGKEYTKDQVWHERQFPVPGLPVGLPPLAYAAWTLSESLSMQKFALDWFSGGGVPKAVLRNTERVLDGTAKPGQSETDARRIKDRYEATVHNGDVFVTGKDWELDFKQAKNSGAEWLEGRKFGLSEVARYFGVPVDLIEAAIPGTSSITYQNSMQRNLQFLVINLQPAVTRREMGLSRLMSRPRFVKLNTNALLRMDPEQQSKVLKTRIESRTITPDEARELYDLPPLTPVQIEQFNTLFPPKGGGESASGGGDEGEKDEGEAA